MTLSHRRKILASFVFATAVLLSVGFLVFVSFLEMRKQSAAVDHTYEVMSTLQGVLSNLKDIQSSQRGFIITGMEDYLTPYYIADPDLEKEIVLLGKLVSDNPEQSARYQGLREHVVERVNIAERIIELYRDKGHDAAVAEIKKGSGKREMDEIRIIVDDMTGEEENLLERRRAAMEMSAKITKIAGAIGLAICIAILGVVFVLIHREAEHRSRTEDDLNKALKEMERITRETQLMGKIGDYLRGCRTDYEAYEIIEKNMPLLFPDTYGSISIFNNSRNLLQTTITWGDAPALEKEFDPEDCWALRQGRLHMNSYDGSVPTCHHLEQLPKDQMTICLPMQAQGETIGQIFIGASKGSREEATRGDLSIMRRATEQISLALANLNLQRVLRDQSIKDPLTKLFNRRYLEETLARECIRAQRHKQPLCLLIMDIDHFKKVNDTYGHDAGDAVLVAFANMLGTKVRKDDVVCRLGGEEFVAVLPTATLDHAITRANEICDGTRKMKITYQNKTIPVTVSVGISLFPDHAETPDDLLNRADSALYKAKSGGRDRAVVYEPEDQPS